MECMHVQVGTADYTAPEVLDTRMRRSGVLPTNAYSSVLFFLLSILCFLCMGAMHAHQDSHARCMNRSFVDKLLTFE